MLLAEETRWTQRGYPQPNAVLTTGFTETMDYIVRAIRKIRGQNFRLNSPFRLFGAFRGSFLFRVL